MKGKKLKAVSGEIVSLTTQRSARLLVVASATFLFVDLFELKPVDWPLLQNDLALTQYQFAAFCVVLFLCLSLFLNWWADYVSYTKWFKSVEVHLGTLAGNSSLKPTEHVLAGLKRKLQAVERGLGDLEKVEKGLEEISEPLEREGQQSRAKILSILNDLDSKLKSLTSKLDLIQSDLNEISDLSGEIRENFSSVDGVTRFVVFVWYLVVPLFLGAAAMIMLAT